MHDTEVANDADVIDSRDVIIRIDYLEGLLSEDECTADEHAELESLRILARQGADYSPDWEYGEAMIRDSYFAEYAQELAEETCEGAASTEWPFRCIDWEQAARELQGDYGSIDFAGITYWIR